MAETAVQHRKKRLDRGIKARTDTIFVIASTRDTLYLLLPRVLPVIALLVLPLLFTGYWGKVLVFACMYGLLALSWDFMASCGLFSLGQALFFGMGAYIPDTLNYYFHIPPIITVPVPTLGSGLLCALILGPVVRLKGVYFAMITLMLPLLLKKMIDTTGIFGGTHGLPTKRCCVSTVYILPLVSTMSAAVFSADAAIGMPENSSSRIAVCLLNIIAPCVISSRGHAPCDR